MRKARARGWVAGRMVYGWERDRRQEMSEWGRQCGDARLRPRRVRCRGNEALVRCVFELARTRAVKVGQHAHSSVEVRGARVGDEAGELRGLEAASSTRAVPKVVNQGLMAVQPYVAQFIGLLSLRVRVSCLTRQQKGSSANCPRPCYTVQMGAQLVAAVAF